MGWPSQECLVGQRLEFVQRLERGEPMAALCREYWISRKTGYRYKKRWKEGGAEALFDRSRAPMKVSNRIPEPIRQQFIDKRRMYPTWGARKLRVLVGEEHPGVKMPALSTVWRILRDAGLITPRKRRRRVPPRQKPLSHAKASNDVWCIDFKGQFRTGDGKYCFPLTITDAYSRALLCCTALESTQTGPVKSVMKEVFRTYGLPIAMRSDNGSPFASTGIQGLSKLSAWWVSLGIRLERIDPGHPEQNGQHERMHRTLKKETTRPAQATLLAQQEAFDRFRERFNNTRPHEALDDRRPAELYQPSVRDYLSDVALDYPLDDLSLRVTSAGYIHPPQRLGLHRQIYVGLALTDQYVGLRELDDGAWSVRFADILLGDARPGESFLHIAP